MGPPTDHGQTTAANASSSPNSTTTIGKGASSALSILLREDPLLTKHGLTTPRPSVSAPNNDDNDANEDAAFSYAAALLHPDSDGSDTWTTSSTATFGSGSESGGGGSNNNREMQKRAAEALAEVERKLALVESLASRVSRESPHDVAVPLLQLHGFDVVDATAISTGSTFGNETRNYKEGKEDRTEEEEDEQGTGAARSSPSTATTLTAVRERCTRLHRQGEMLENVAVRVESTLRRGLTRMENTTGRLSRALDISACLKMILRLQFELRKIRGCGLDLDMLLHQHRQQQYSGTFDSMSMVDPRDLARAAASVAVVEELLASPELSGGSQDGTGKINVVEKMRPEAEAVASAVRRAAAGLLAEQYSTMGGTSGSGGSTNSQQMSASKLGATLQVYYHLGELSQAVWNAVENGLAAAEKASSQFFNPAAIQRLLESATAEARASADAELSDSSAAATAGADISMEKKRIIPTTASTTTTKRQADAIYERALRTKLREKKAEAATKWSMGINDATMRIWNLHRVLRKKTDPVTRQTFLDVVFNGDPIPEKFKQASDMAAASAGGSSASSLTFSIFTLFWNQLCIALGLRIQRLLKYDNGSLASEG